MLSGPKPHREPDNEQGIALISVMWFLLVNGVIVAVVLAMTRSYYLTVNTRERTAVLGYAAEGAVNRVIYDALKATRADQRKPKPSTTITVGDIRVMVTARSEAGKLNINLAEPELIRSLLIVSGVEDDEARGISDAIADWRDEDDVRLTRGAEALDYRSDGVSYTPRNGPFPTLGELAQVKGMTPRLMSCLLSDLTIYTSGAGIDESVASARLKNALARNRGDQPDKRNGTSVMRPGGANLGAAWRIVAEAEDESGSKYALEAIVMLSGNKREPYWVHAWRRAFASGDRSACVGK